ncbi:FxsA family protein [Frischella perrara]|uniref:FxsA family protein n=1 Tax=Frischella perrara TaxID=1267021 RepID=UPI0023F0AF22|nr:FxsA family protein [Frischella perrara]
MHLLTFIIFFVYLYIEFSIFNAVANMIGVFFTLIAIIMTSVIGFYLVKSQGIKNFILMKDKIANRENPTNEIVKSVSLLFAGILLLIPGFFTDILGAILIFPPIQDILIQRIVQKKSFKTYSNRHSSKQNIDDTVIDGEFTHKDDE